MKKHELSRKDMQNTKSYRKSRKNAGPGRSLHQMLETQRQAKDVGISRRMYTEHFDRDAAESR